MTFETWICVGVCVWFSTVLYFSMVRTWPVSSPLGWLRRLRDHVKRADVIAAAQVATLASNPELAEQFLERYGLNLCPSCGQHPPSPPLLWYCIDDNAKYHWVRVCGKCHLNPPIGWRQDIEQAAQQRVRIARNSWTRTQERLQLAQERFEKRVRQFENRVRERFRR